MIINVKDDRVIFIYENAKEQTAFRYLEKTGQQNRAVQILARLVEQTEQARQELRRQKLIDLYTASNPDIRREVRRTLGWNDAD